MPSGHGQSSKALPQTHPDLHGPAFAYGYGEAGISVPRLAELKESSRSRVKNPLIWRCASERSVDPAIGEG
jgi:hypothetical protein